MDVSYIVDVSNTVDDLIDQLFVDALKTEPLNSTQWVLPIWFSVDLNFFSMLIKREDIKRSIQIECIFFQLSW